MKICVILTSLLFQILFFNIILISSVQAITPVMHIHSATYYSVLKDSLPFTESAVTNNVKNSVYTLCRSQGPIGQAAGCLPYLCLIPVLTSELGGLNPAKGFKKRLCVEFTCCRAGVGAHHTTFGRVCANEGDVLYLSCDIDQGHNAEEMRIFTPSISSGCCAGMAASTIAFAGLLCFDILKCSKMG